MNPFVFQTTPRIVCEQGAAANLGAHAGALHGRRAFVVTDAGLVRAGVAHRALDSLAAAGIEPLPFSDVQPDPPEAMVEQAVARARAAKVDLVIGLGGGSSMDTAKLVALLAGSGQTLAEVVGTDVARGPRLPLIQVPTTAGTGSEVTPIAIVTTPSHEKKGVVSPLLYPDLALLDGTLTLGLPPAVTAMTGIDAMVHAIEAFTSRVRKNPLSDTFALRALQLLRPHLERVLANGEDAAAREAMLLGSLMAGIAFANAPVAAVHALAYPLGGHFGLPHGLSNALVLAPVLRFNLPAAEAAYAQIARALMPAAQALPDGAAARLFVDDIAALVARMPFAHTLRAAGVPADALPMLAADAMKVQRLLVNNPRPVAEAEALALYRQAH